MEKAKQLEEYIDSVIKRLNDIKKDLDKEIKGEYFSLSCIAWQMEVYTIRDYRRRKGKDDSDSENELLP
jgi:uncharacterized protein (UPF0335 family)